MIIQTDSIDNLFSFDVGRPEMINNDDFIMWQKFFLYIENTPHEILINGAYTFCREYAFKQKAYFGGGFKFMFFCKDQETCDIVEKESLSILGRIPTRGFLLNGKFYWMPIETGKKLEELGKGKFITFEEWNKIRPKAINNPLSIYSQHMNKINQPKT